MTISFLFHLCVFLRPFPGGWGAKEVLLWLIEGEALNENWCGHWAYSLVLLLADLPQSTLIDIKTPVHGARTERLPLYLDGSWCQILHGSLLLRAVEDGITAATSIECRFNTAVIFH